MHTWEDFGVDRWMDHGCGYMCMWEKGDDSSREFEGEDDRNLRCGCPSNICLLALFSETYHNPCQFYPRKRFYVTA